MVIEESGLRFDFGANAETIKYDDTGFYRNYVNGLPDSKGVDFLSIQDKRLVMIEVKNCTGNESDNNWRIFKNNQKVNTSHTKTDVTGRESLDIEVSKKVAMTISGLVGACTKAAGCQSAAELVSYGESLLSGEVRAGEKQILVILFLEGRFGSLTKSKAMIMKDLQESIKKKLSWLNCRVSVVDSDTYSKKIFRIEKVA